MARDRGAEFVTGKEVGAEDMVIALEEVGGVCWARQVDMLFTVVGLLVWIGGMGRGART